MLLKQQRNPRLAAWVAVLTTVSSALAAQVAAARYDFLVMSDSGTARKLEALVNQWPFPSKGNRHAWSSVVKSCEDAISAGDESWLAKWMKSPQSVAMAWVQARTQLNMNAGRPFIRKRLFDESAAGTGIAAGREARRERDCILRVRVHSCRDPT
jgi:hypothetical protein